MAQSAICLSISKSLRAGKTINQAVRKDWKPDIEKAGSVDFVFAVNNGEVVEVYDNSRQSWKYNSSNGRYFFVGKVSKKLRPSFISNSIRMYGPYKYVINTKDVSGTAIWAE